MKIQLGPLTLTLLTALGLAPACSVGPLAEGGAEHGGSGNDGESETNSTETGEPLEPYVCNDPQPILQAGSDEPSGFVRCDDGFIHRVETVDALSPQGPDSPECVDYGTTCETAGDCVAKAHGSCVFNEHSGCLCEYGCVTDADCGAGAICAPAGVAGSKTTCITAECVTDGDCGDGLCGLSAYEGCCARTHRLACADPTEPCHTNADCPAGPCEWSGSGETAYLCSVQGDDAFPGAPWTCRPPSWCSCACGRPFVVDGQVRVAPAVACRDWCVDLRIPVRPISAHDPGTRELLARHWTQVGQFEHASVASFARFAMQLMQLGAPPGLLRDTARALADEIEHARLTFALASAYAGRSVGPGRLVAGNTAAPTHLRDIVEGLIVEACVGETLAALEAREAALSAEDPGVAAVLEQIADDEWRHAELGWRALRWVLEQGDADLRAFALSCFELAITAVAAAEVSGGPDLREHGVLGGRQRAELRLAGLRRVVSPCVAALRSREHHGEATPRPPCAA